MNPNSSQRGNNNRPLFVPTLMPMPGSSLQVINAGGNMGPIFTSSAMGQSLTMPTTSLQPLSMERPPQPVTIMQPVRPQQRAPPPKADLYLCKTAGNESEPASDGDVENKGKVSLSDLKHSFKDLDSQQIKDTLSSFLPHVPGEFDRMPDTMLRQLLDQRTIGGKDFSPLSGQALLGFRLLPGPLPESYRMDPSSVESKSHHKKRKNKHVNIEKGEDGVESVNGPSAKIKVPNDAYSFINNNISTATPHIAMAPTHHSHPHTAYLVSGDSAVGGMTRQHQPTNEILAAAVHTTPFGQQAVTMPHMQIAGAPAQLMTTSGGIIMDPSRAFSGKKIKKPKKDKTKHKKDKGERKEKKKKKHHSQDPSGPGPSILPHQPPGPFNQFPNT